MAKKKIHIDELFRRELGDMKMPVDSNDWAAMQAQIAEGQDKRKRRVFWWWFTGIALLLLVGATTTYYLLDTNNSQSVTIVAENTITTPSIETPSETKTSTQNDTEIENVTSNQPINSELPSPENAKAKNTNTPTSTPKPSSAKKGTVKPSKSGSENFTDLPDNDGNGEKKNNGSNENKGEKGDSNMETPYPKKEQQTLPKKTPTPTITENGDSNTTEESTVTKLVLPDSAKTTDDSLKVVDENMLRRSRATKPKFEPSPFSIGFHIGGATNNYIAENNSQLGRIVNNNNENSFVANAEILANYKINDFEINSGIGVKSITQSINYDITQQIFDSIPVLNSQGQIIGYFYTNFRDTAYTQMGISNLNYITVPIGVTYNKEINGKSGLRFSANTTLHYLEFATGDYINPFNLFGMSVDRNRDLFRKWNIGVGASIGYYYTFKPQWSLEASINYNTLTNGIFDDRVGTAIRPSSIGLNVGIRYNIKMKK